MRPAPDLSDPAQRAAYRAELRGVARGMRIGGLALALAGASLAFLMPLVPGVPRWAPVLLIVPAAALMLTGATIRTRHHLRRMRGEG